MTRSRNFVSHLMSVLILGSGLLVLIQQVKNLSNPWGLILTGIGGVAAGLFIQPLGHYLGGGFGATWRRTEKNEEQVSEALPRRDFQGRLETEFLTQFSHDLRTPVTSLGWSLRNLQDGLLGEVNPRQFEYLESMNQAVHQLDGLVAGLPEIRRAERGEVSHGT